jgi:hypothetical protein
VLTVGNAICRLADGRKVPDGGFYAFKTLKSPVVPQMVLEVGYSQSYESLVRDCRRWLLGSAQVRSVLLVKFVKPDDGDMRRINRWRVWIEIWVRTEDGR